MIRKIEKAIYMSFGLIFFTLPLIVIPTTSELFEFNKMVFIYLLTAFITTLWLAKIILTKKLEFQGSKLKIPLIVFLLTNLISTYFSIDKHMSIFGYYSRFNGGILSLVSYTVLYFAFINNIKKEQTLNLIKMIFISGFLVSSYGVLQKLGIDKNVWVQDVQNRVFASLGQPNWLAAWLVLILPLTFGYSFYFGKKKTIKTAFLLSITYFLVILFTKSRSGILGFTIANILFWTISFTQDRQNRFIKKAAIAFNIAIIFITFLTGTPWTPSLKNLISNNKTTESTLPGTTLETGGTESGAIRKIVWKGAILIWKDYPLLGSGPETFALSYFKYKPKEHNLTSEWDFVYNKAHNEYLNYLANTGIIGLLSYIFLISLAILIMIKKSVKNPKKEIKKKEKFISIGILSGYLGFLITNIFGFSVVATSFLFFIYPAIIVSLDNEKKKEDKFYFDNLSKIKIILLVFIFIFTSYQIIKYWEADFYYNQGKNQNRLKNYTSAEIFLDKATKLNAGEPVYKDELAKIYLNKALDTYNKGNKKETEILANKALDTIKETIKSSPSNIFFRKAYSSILIQLTIINPNLTQDTISSLNELSKLAPTDPKVLYNLGLIYLRLNEYQKAKEVLKKSVDLKSNYRDARLALSVAYSKLNEKENAKKELEYILENINPNDEMVKNQLEELK